MNDIEKNTLKNNFVQQSLRAQIAYSFNYFHTLMTRSTGQTREVVILLLKKIFRKKINFEYITIFKTVTLTASQHKESLSFEAPF